MDPQPALHHRFAAARWSGPVATESTQGEAGRNRCRKLQPEEAKAEEAGVIKGDRRNSEDREGQAELAQTGNQRERKRSLRAEPLAPIGISNQAAKAHLTGALKQFGFIGTLRLLASINPALPIELRLVRSHRIIIYRRS